MRTGKKCHWCGRKLKFSAAFSGLAETKDHVNPRRLGGGKTVPCCTACNSIKGGRSLEEWHEYMVANPKWWEKYKLPKKKPNYPHGYFTADNVESPKSYEGEFNE